HRQRVSAQGAVRLRDRLRAGVRRYRGDGDGRSHHSGPQDPGQAQRALRPADPQRARAHPAALPPGVGPSPGAKLDHTVDLAKQLGAPTVVVHPPFRWQYRYARTFAEHVRELNDAHEVTIAVENMYPWRGPKREMQAYLPDWDPTE